MIALQKSLLNFISKYTNLGLGRFRILVVLFILIGLVGRPASMPGVHDFPSALFAGIQLVTRSVEHEIRLDQNDNAVGRSAEQGWIAVAVFVCLK